jgi:hypothetical protein
MKRSALVAAVALLAGPWPGAPASAACIQEGEAVDLYGTITREAFPGPPNYRSIEHGDAADIAFIITSETPYDICATDPKTGAPRPIGQVLRFQLFRSPDLMLSQLPVVFARGHVRGTITVGLTGPYHTAAAVEVIDFENTGPWSPKPWPPGARISAYIPVTASFERELVGAGQVVRIRNQSTQSLTIEASIVNPKTGATRSVALTLPPLGSRPIGRAQGWAFASGDRLLLHDAAFSDVAFQVP